jgi:hypothetical protein
MLWVNHSEATARRRFTLIYRGYDLEVTRESFEWKVRVPPKSPDLPILAISEVYACDRDQAVAQAKERVDGTLSILAYC